MPPLRLASPCLSRRCVGLPRLVPCQPVSPGAASSYLAMRHVAPRRHASLGAMLRCVDPRCLVPHRPAPPCVARRPSPCPALPCPDLRDIEFGEDDGPDPFPQDFERKLKPMWRSGKGP
ncbi:hypothetical protein GUJ93_ZPchr0001g31682 [Zizania palustris]|uniref:Uncharacterized protein n=1 Tax=Zizania palustris TaxID=103762 RepID=A0A8J5RM72_ZIZPA|nr:hypothetical protein GUJ93_ZPchr0001g31682 [Zizania palustris]